MYVYMYACMHACMHVTMCKHDRIQYETIPAVSCISNAGIVLVLVSEGSLLSLHYIKNYISSSIVCCAPFNMYTHAHILHILHNICSNSTGTSITMDSATHIDSCSVHVRVMRVYRYMHIYIYTHVFSMQDILPHIPSTTCHITCHVLIER